MECKLGKEEVKTQEENCWNLVHWNRVRARLTFKTSEELEAGLINDNILLTSAVLPLISFYLN